MRPFGSLSRAVLQTLLLTAVVAPALTAQRATVTASPEVAAQLAAARARLAAESYAVPVTDVAALVTAPAT